MQLYGIGNLMCITDPNYYLQGDYYSQEFDYIEVKLNKCSGNNCANKTTIDNFLNPQTFSVAFVNSYFDFTSY